MKKALRWIPDGLSDESASSVYSKFDDGQEPKQAEWAMVTRKRIQEYPHKNPSNLSPVKPCDEYRVKLIRGIHTGQTPLSSLGRNLWQELHIPESNILEGIEPSLVKRTLLRILLSANSDVVNAMIEGNICQRSIIDPRMVCALETQQRQAKKGQPCIYLNVLADHDGLGLMASEIEQVLQLMEAYIKPDPTPEDNLEMFTVDRLWHSAWSRENSLQGRRKYLEDENKDNEEPGRKVLGRVDAIETFIENTRLRLDGRDPSQPQRVAPPLYRGRVHEQYGSTIQATPQPPVV